MEKGPLPAKFLLEQLGMKAGTRLETPPKIFAQSKKGRVFPALRTKSTLSSWEKFCRRGGSNCRGGTYFASAKIAKRGRRRECTKSKVAGKAGVKPLLHAGERTTLYRPHGETMKELARAKKKIQNGGGATDPEGKGRTENTYQE